LNNQETSLKVSIEFGKR